MKMFLNVLAWCVILPISWFIALFLAYLIDGVWGTQGMGGVIFKSVITIACGAGIALLCTPTIAAIRMSWEWLVDVFKDRASNKKV